MVSVIIPTLNEEKNIENCISDVLRKANQKIEIIVVDAGSKDLTVNIVKSMREITVISDIGLKGKKYASLNKGAQMAHGEALLFLDADTILPEHFQSQIEKALRTKQVVGGAFEMVFDKYTLLLRWIRFVNSIRYNLTKRCYGDQAIFCKRETFLQVGGYPKKIVLEAAGFCQRLMKVGKFTIIKKPVITSSRRFIEGGVLKTFLFDLYLLSSDNLGLDIEKPGKKYWEKNA